MMKVVRLWWAVMVALTMVGIGSPAWTQTLAHKGWAGSGITVEGWWDGAVFYQVDPVSFQDSSDDGFGDLKGIVQRLDYLQALGVDAIVLSPFSLQPEFARTKGGPPFDPAYGTEEDLDRLVEEAGRRKVRILVDLPLNGSRLAEDSISIARFWLSRGIAGLRLTASSGSAGALTNGEVAERIRELRRVTAGYAGQRVLLRELPDVVQTETTAAAGGRTRRHVAAAYGRGAEGAQLVVDQHLALLPAFGASGLRAALTARAEGAGATTVSVLDGADRPRSVDRYGDGMHDGLIAKGLAAVQMLGRGTPLLYFGQEIGMATTPAPVANSLGGYGGDTTPMQWGGEPGFTKGVPWIDMGRNAATANVALEDQDTGSLLNWYRKLSALRHENVAVRSGSMDVLAESNPDVVAWVRRTQAGGVSAPAVLTVVNVTGRAVMVSLASDLRRVGLGGAGLRTLASTAIVRSGDSGVVQGSAIVLPAFGVLIAEASGSAGLELAPAPVRRASSRAHGSRRRR